MVLVSQQTEEPKLDFWRKWHRLMVVSCNAAGLSNNHFIKKWMAPFSNQPDSILLTHYSYGTHLDCTSKTKHLKKLNIFKNWASITRHLFSIYHWLFSRNCYMSWCLRFCSQFQIIHWPGSCSAMVWKPSLYLEVFVADYKK